MFRKFGKLIVGLVFLLSVGSAAAGVMDEKTSEIIMTEGEVVSEYTSEGSIFRVLVRFKSRIYICEATLQLGTSATEAKTELFCWDNSWVDKH
ncbi:MAG: hypothetical protein HOJ76_06625 [Proteobacteria bacterium]|nr:hypothetical protein [Pseudomonadota bacterium]